MKKMVIVLTLVSAVLFAAQGCIGLEGSCFNHRTVRGSGKLASEDRPVEDINAVKLATIGTLHIKIGDTESLEIEAEENLLDYIETDVHGGELIIDTRRVNLRTRRPIRYHLTVKELNSIKITSSGDIEAPDIEAGRFSISISSSGSLDMGDLDAERVRIKISSSGDVIMGELNARSLAVGISSSGNVRIQGGEVEEQDIRISSSGDYRARDLASREAEVHISSSGNAILRVSGYLGAYTSSSGDIRYIGDPELDYSETSSGDVQRIGRGQRSRSI
jgi:hypothetical protein